jgi:hypothetical protein
VTGRRRPPGHGPERFLLPCYTTPAEQLVAGDVRRLIERAQQVLDLPNLLPVCAQHHTRLHTEGWELSLGPQRRLTIRFPDGNVLSTGPPRRRVA